MIAHGFWFGPGWGLLAGLASLAFWVLVVVVVIGLLRGRSDGRAPFTSSALRILEERYARGAISQQEFEERRRVLTEQASPGRPEKPAD